MNTAGEPNSAAPPPSSGEFVSAKADAGKGEGTGRAADHTHRRRRWLPTRPQAVAAFLVAGALLLFSDHFVVESVVVPSSSMEPTILPNERVFLSRLPGRAIGRFDVVVVDSRALGRRIAKRVVALPGERVRLEASWKVFVNGTPLDYSEVAADHTRVEAGDHAVRLAGGPNPTPPTEFGGEDLLLGPDEYYVLGDNRFASVDSRVIGPVKRGEIQGRLGLVWYSFDLQQHRVRTERLARLVR